MPSRPLFACALLGAVLPLALSDARADITGVPDFDQRRNGLLAGTDGTPGSSCCMPTSIMDVFYFLEEHGFHLFTGQPDEGDDAAVTANIATLAVFLGTTADGSLGPNYSSQIQTYLTFENLSGVNSDPMLISWVGAESDPNNDVTYSNMKAWFDLPTNLVLNQTRYDDQSTTFSGKLDITGGHFVALVGLSKSGSNVTIEYKDPWTDESECPRDLDHNSDYVKESAVYSSEYHNYVGTKTSLLRVKFDAAHPGLTRNAIHGYLVLRPLFMLTDFSNALDASAVLDRTESDTLGRGFHAVLPGNDRLGGPETVPIPLTTGPVSDVAVSSVAPTALYIEEGSRDVREVVIGAGSRVLATLNAPHGVAYGGATAAVPFVLDGPRIVALDRNGRPHRKTRPPGPVDAIAWDSVRGRLVAASLAAQKLFYYEENLTRDEPDAADPLPLVPGDGRLSIGADPQSRQVWLHRDGSNVVVALRYDARGSAASREVTLFTSASPVGLVVDRDRIYTSENGFLQEYELSGAVARTPHFAGIRSGGVFAIPRNYYGNLSAGPVIDSVAKDWGTLTCD